MKVIAECPVEESLINELIESSTIISTPQRYSLSVNDLITLLEALTKRVLSIRGFENGKYFQK